MKRILLFLALLSLSCSDSGLSPESRDFNLKLRYGIAARNELNTFQNSYTKDLIIDGTVTAPFVLSDAEFEQIKSKMIEIDFFSYPATFTLVRTDTIVVSFEPHPTYDFEVKYNSSIKRLCWDDGIITNDQRATRLREFIRLIQNIVEAKPEYRQLPPARGGYA
ncbi:MAG: hypothetical protein WBW16_12740 [Bacteroidota bacterium]